MDTWNSFYTPDFSDLSSEDTSFLHSSPSGKERAEKGGYDTFWEHYEGPALKKQELSDKNQKSEKIDNLIFDKKTVTTTAAEVKILESQVLFCDDFWVFSGDNQKTEKSDGNFCDQNASGKAGTETKFPKAQVLEEDSFWDFLSKERTKPKKQTCDDILHFLDSDVPKLEQDISGERQKTKVLEGNSCDCDAVDKTAGYTKISESQIQTVDDSFWDFLTNENKQHIKKSSDDFWDFLESDMPLKEKMVSSNKLKSEKATKFYDRDIVKEKTPEVKISETHVPTVDEATFWDFLPSKKLPDKKVDDALLEFLDSGAPPNDFGVFSGDKPKTEKSNGNFCDRNTLVKTTAETNLTVDEATFWDFLLSKKTPEKKADDALLKFLDSDASTNEQVLSDEKQKTETSEYNFCGHKSVDNITAEAKISEYHTFDRQPDSCRAKIEKVCITKSESSNYNPNAEMKLPIITSFYSLASCPHDFDQSMLFEIKDTTGELYFGASNLMQEFVPRNNDVGAIDQIEENNILLQSSTFSDPICSPDSRKKSIFNISSQRSKPSMKRALVANSPKNSIFRVTDSKPAVYFAENETNKMISDVTNSKKLKASGEDSSLKIKLKKDSKLQNKPQDIDHPGKIAQVPNVSLRTNDSTSRVLLIPKSSDGIQNRNAEFYMITDNTTVQKDKSGSSMYNNNENPIITVIPLPPSASIVNTQVANSMLQTTNIGIPALTPTVQTINFEKNLHPNIIYKTLDQKTVNQLTSCNLPSLSTAISVPCTLYRNQKVNFHINATGASKHATSLSIPVLRNVSCSISSLKKVANINAPGDIVQSKRTSEFCPKRAKIKPIKNISIGKHKNAIQQTSIPLKMKNMVEDQIYNSLQNQSCNNPLEESIFQQQLLPTAVKRLSTAHGNCAPPQQLILNKTKTTDWIPHKAHSNSILLKKDLITNTSKVLTTKNKFFKSSHNRQPPENLGICQRPPDNKIVVNFSNNDGQQQYFVKVSASDVGQSVPVNGPVNQTLPSQLVGKCFINNSVTGSVSTSENIPSATSIPTTLQGLFQPQLSSLQQEKISVIKNLATQCVSTSRNTAPVMTTQTTLQKLLQSLQLYSSQQVRKCGVIKNLVAHSACTSYSTATTVSLQDLFPPLQSHSLDQKENINVIRNNVTQSVSSSGNAIPCANQKENINVIRNNGTQSVSSSGNAIPCTTTLATSQQGLFMQPQLSHSVEQLGNNCSIKNQTPQTVSTLGNTVIPKSTLATLQELFPISVIPVCVMQSVQTVNAAPVVSKTKPVPRSNRKIKPINSITGRNRPQPPAKKTQSKVKKTGRKTVRELLAEKYKISTADYSEIYHSRVNPTDKLGDNNVFGPTGGSDQSNKTLNINKQNADDFRGSNVFTNVNKRPDIIILPSATRFTGVENSSGKGDPEKEPFPILKPSCVEIPTGATLINQQSPDEKRTDYRSRFYDMCELSIGYFKVVDFVDSCGRFLSKFKILFTKRQFVYDFPVNKCNQIDDIGNDYEWDAWVRVMVPFKTMEGISMFNRRINVKVTTTPKVFLWTVQRPEPTTVPNSKRFIPSSDNSIWNDAVRSSFLHKITLRKRQADNLKDQLYKFDPSMILLFNNGDTLCPAIVDASPYEEELASTKLGKIHHKNKKTLRRLPQWDAPESFLTESPLTQMDNSSLTANHACSCRSSCRSLRCSCVKTAKCCNAGGTTCQCTACDNPLNVLESFGLDLAMSLRDSCLFQNIYQVPNLRGLLLQDVKLSCCNKTARVVDCIPGAILCPNTDCNARLEFSWCRRLICHERNPRNHCSFCGQCCFSNGRHCQLCNKCYVVTSKRPQCRHCRRDALKPVVNDSPRMPLLALAEGISVKPQIILLDSAGVNNSKRGLGLEDQVKERCETPRDLYFKKDNEEMGRFRSSAPEVGANQVKLRKDLAYDSDGFENLTKYDYDSDNFKILIENILESLKEEIPNKEVKNETSTPLPELEKPALISSFQSDLPCKQETTLVVEIKKETTNL